MAWCGTSNVFALCAIWEHGIIYMAHWGKGRRPLLARTPLSHEGWGDQHLGWSIAIINTEAWPGSAGLETFTCQCRDQEAEEGAHLYPWHRQPGAHNGNLPRQYAKCSLGRCLTKTLSDPTDTKLLTRLCHRESWEAEEALWCFRSDKSRDLEGQVTLRVKVNDKTVRPWQDKGHRARRAEFQTWWTQNWAESDGECGLETVLRVPKLRRQPSDLTRTHITTRSILYRQLSHLNPCSRSLAVE